MDGHTESQITPRHPDLLITHSNSLNIGPPQHTEVPAIHISNHGFNIQIQNYQHPPCTRFKIKTTSFNNNTLRGAQDYV